MADTPLFGFSDANDALGFSDVNDPSVGGIWNSLETPVDHVGRGLSRLPLQFQNSENLKHFLQILLEEVQELEESAYEINKRQSIEFAEGVQLDLIGEDVGIRREGVLSDDLYRNLIWAKTLVNASEGDPSSVYKVWEKLMGKGVEMKEVFPAGVELFAPKRIPNPYVIPLVKEALALCIDLSLITVKDEGPAFCFQGGIGEGFSSTDNPSSGGQFVSIYRVS